VPTASGFGKHRTVHPPEASAALEDVLGAVRDADAEAWVHCCAADAPLGLLRGAGATGLLVDLSLAGPAAHDALAEALEAGVTVGLGVVPGREPAGATGEKQYVEQVARWLDMVGLDPAEVSEHLVVTPACGLAGADATWARRALETCRAVAAEF